MNTNKELAKYRLEQAKECLTLAEATLDQSSKNAANRSYYCIFHAMRAVLALDKFDSKKHSGVISYFQQHYIKTKIFDANFSTIIKKAFQIRSDSDYEDFYIAQKSDVIEQIENAKIFLNAVEAYIGKLPADED